MTLKPLLGKPGFLTQQFISGKRTAYINPVRLFIFLNFIFFLLLFSLPSNSHKKIKDQLNAAGIEDPDAKKLLDSIEQIKVGVVTLTSSNGDFSAAQYDSLQKVLPANQRDGLLKRASKRKLFDILGAVKKDPDSVTEKMNEVFLHNAAKLTFLFLLVCTLLLSSLYRRSHILMVNHALFAIHLACTFLLLSIFMLLLHYAPLGQYLVLFVFLYGAYYFYRALRKCLQAISIQNPH